MERPIFHDRILSHIEIFLDLALCIATQEYSVAKAVKIKIKSQFNLTHELLLTNQFCYLKITIQLAKLIINH